MTTTPSVQPLRVLIVDDEPHARAGVRAVLARRPTVAIAGESGDGAAAIEAIERLRPDVVLLDVQMPERSGFDVIRHVGVERMPPVVFVTAYDQYAIDAFDAHAVDYVVKPFQDARLLAAVDRAAARVRDVADSDFARRLATLVRTFESGGPSTPTPSAAPSDLRFAVQTGARTVYVRVDEVDWIEGAAYYAKLHAAQRTVRVRETLASIERRLDPRRFVRVHRSAIVNLDRVRELGSGRGGAPALVLQDGTTIRVSRRRRRALEQVVARTTV